MSVGRSKSAQSCLTSTTISQDDSMPEFSDTKESQTDSISKIKLLKFFAYCLMTVCCGALEPLGGSLYNELESQLNTSSTTIAYMLSLKAIVSAIAAIISAWILDHMIHSHYYISLVCIITGATICLLPHITVLWPMYATFVVIGYCIGAIFVTYPVYVLRLYPRNDRALFALMGVYGVSKTVTPIIIQLSIKIFNSYSYAIYFISIVFGITALLLFCLSTPQHDPFRSIVGQRANVLQPEKALFIGLAPHEIRKSNRKLQRYHYALYALLILMEFCFSALQSGTVNFIQKFVTNHLHKDSEIARDLIASYYFGQLLYRIVVAVFLETVNPIKSVFLSNMILILFGLLYTSYGNISFINDSEIWLLFVIFINIGIWASPIYPGIVKWAESIEALTGLISGVIIISFSLGDASTVTMMGHLIEAYGEYIVPFPICAYMMISLVLTIMARCTYFKYCDIRNNSSNLAGLIFTD